MTKPPLFLKAFPSQNQMLSDLAFRSKSSWKYSKEYLEASRSLIALNKKYIETNEVRIGYVERNDESECFGFFSLCFEVEMVLLDHFWIEPHFFQQGLGSLMFYNAVKLVKNKEKRFITIYTDPPAEGFYLKMGAKRIGEKPSRLKGGPVFPILLFTLI